MLRTALRPANLGLLLLMVAAAVVFSLLGEWQLGRSQQHARVSPTETVVPIGEVIQPAADFTGHADHQRVSVSGTWADLPVEEVPDRPLDGRGGTWVVAALQESTTGGLLPVLLGWQPAGQAPPEAPTGAAQLTGRLMASEQPTGVAADGQLRALSSGDLVNVWPGRLYTGYLVADAGSAGQPRGLVAVPSEAPVPRLDPQNLSYAFQWWLFAAFALVMWVKIVKDRHGDELEDRRLAELEAAGEGYDDDGGGAAGDPPDPAPRPVRAGLRAWEDVAVPEARPLTQPDAPQVPR
ncbi:SURF1 family protein [Quadrisphaera setariae]|uniref:SURF1-like protein n=1 Tax=Quadrisphaera setariae TaxID=2593304 RepID=A0A5C8ZJQ5_9ACTN|nr:SURF1 family protein [Quadrisphaera setariae]TXR57854.1 SURF1 family protein [Quadrisphaera setariae]